MKFNQTYQLILENKLEDEIKNGYTESDKDYVLNNIDICVKFLDSVSLQNENLKICHVCNGAGKMINHLSNATFPCSNPNCKDGKIRELTKEKIMSQLGITEGDIVLFPDIVLEKLYLASILNQGIDIATKTLNEVNKFRDLVFGEGYER